MLWGDLHGIAIVPFQFIGGGEYICKQYSHTLNKQHMHHLCIKLNTHILQKKETLEWPHECEYIHFDFFQQIMVNFIICLLSMKHKKTKLPRLRKSYIKCYLNWMNCIVLFAVFFSQSRQTSPLHEFKWNLIDILLIVSDKLIT